MRTLSTWANNITPTVNEISIFNRLLSEEINYLNSVLSGLNGPIRTMPEVIKKMFNDYQKVFGIVAMKRQPISKIIQGTDEDSKYVKSLLYTGDTLNVSTQMISLLDIAAKPGILSPLSRKCIALSLLNYANEQAVARTQTSKKTDQEFRHAMEVLTPLEEKTKKNLQLPREAIDIKEVGRELHLKLPYSTNRFVISKPPFEWNLLVLRNTGNQWRMELRNESSAYLLRLYDKKVNKR